MTDISAIIVAHREGALAGVSMHSLVDAVSVARGQGLTAEILVVLDAPDRATRDIFADAGENGWRLEEVNFHDQGQTRNHAAAVSAGTYLAFLDADDLWGEDWLVEAHKLCMTDPGRIIAHPEMNWFFQGNDNLLFNMDQTDPAFDPAFMRFANYWDALSLSPRSAHLDHPYADRAVKDGYAYEDWQWNCDTMQAGFIHRVAPGTIHFKRRRSVSQTLEASHARTLRRRVPLDGYAWYETATGLPQQPSG